MSAELIARVALTRVTVLTGLTGLTGEIDQIARRIGGRVVAPELDGLGAAVIGDYLRSRRAR